MNSPSPGKTSQLSDRTHERKPLFVVPFCAAFDELFVLQATANCAKENKETEQENGAKKTQSV